ncbi:MAG: monovalent cation/H(+) antiporter subunit G [Alphaproteobacteria bacterium]|nr:monovalent cation/H(+) antiporter subunit G [Alphaproteobacteria bacterium]
MEASAMLDLFSVACVLGGAILFMAGTIGLLRFPDQLTRLHALTKVDNLGLGLIVLGLLPQFGWLTGVKLFCTWLLVQLSGAIVTQLIGGAIRTREPRR